MTANAQDRELIEEMESRIEDFRQVPHGWADADLLQRARDALIAHEQQRSQAAVCQRCKGSGDIMTMTQGHGPDDYEFATTCPDCDGTGVPAADPPRDQPAASPADGLVENLHRIAREQRVSKIWTIWLCAAADRIERDAQDASRYRWILGHYSVDDVAGDIGAWGAGDFDTLDAAIDAAMKDKNA